MAFKMIVFKTPNELDNFMGPIWKEMLKDYIAQKGPVGGVILEPNMNTGYCNAYYFPREDYLQLREISKKLLKKYQDAEKERKE